MKEYTLPPALYYGILVAFITLVVSLALTTSVSTAMYALAAGFVIHAASRVFLPAGAVPEVRSRAFDVATCLLVAALLIYFAGWGDTPQV